MTTAVDEKEEWLVWSNEHAAWWRPKACGYTTDIAQAGRFSESVADVHCASRSYSEGIKPEVKVFAPEYDVMRKQDPLKAIKLRHGYSGSEWMKLQLGYRKEREAGKKMKNPPVPYEMSPFGETVADILGYVWRGIYHMDTKALDKVDWSRNWIEVRMYRNHDLATYDGSELTELVVLCHDHSIRFSVHGVFGGYLKLSFHRRQRSGDINERHPTIEDSIKKIRSIEA